MPFISIVLLKFLAICVVFRLFSNTLDDCWKERDVLSIWKLAERESRKSNTNV